MILLDTHIWIWWVHGDESLTGEDLRILQTNESSGLGISVISCWEVAKLVQYDRLSLPCSVSKWFEEALGYAGITLLDLTPEIALESTRLPGRFHRDPADQMIVATARLRKLPLLTHDCRILQYPHVSLASSF